MIFATKQFFIFIELFTCNPPRCWCNPAVSDARKRRNNRRIRLPFFSPSSLLALPNMPVMCSAEKVKKYPAEIRKIPSADTSERAARTILRQLSQCVPFFSRDQRDFIISFLENSTYISCWSIVAYPLWLMTSCKLCLPMRQNAKKKRRNFCMQHDVINHTCRNSFEK